MSKRPPNTAIGEIECPYKGCSQICKVFKFRARTEGRLSVFTGKLYADCPVHGRIGNDGNPATQEHYLEKATIWGANRPAAVPDPVPEKPAKNPAPAPTPAPKIASNQNRNSPAPSPPTQPSATRTTWRPLID